MKRRSHTLANLNYLLKFLCFAHFEFLYFLIYFSLLLRSSAVIPFLKPHLKRLKELFCAFFGPFVMVHWATRVFCLTSWLGLTAGAWFQRVL